jgi:tripartite-type tricarboxylate transporter receptor subunit TctC
MQFDLLRRHEFMGWPSNSRAAEQAQFIVYAKSNPGKLNMGSAGIGNGTHLA